MAWLESIGYILKDPLLDGGFKWSVPNFFCLFTNQALPCISSPWFSFKNNKWRLVLLPNDFFPNLPKHLHGNKQRYIGLFLWGKSKNRNDKFHIRIGLESKNCNLLDGYSLSHKGRIKSGEDIGNWKFLPTSTFLDHKSLISPKGNMSIICEITKLDPNSEDNKNEQKKHDDDSSEDDDDDHKSEEEDDDESEEEEEDDDDDDDDDTSDSSLSDVSFKDKKNALETKGIDRLLQNLEKMLLDGQNTDMILKVESHEFRVHKGILGVRSPVFASMLQHDMEEKSSNVVDIPDCSAEAFKIFLLYLYTGKADKISAENVFNLYYAADKYHVDDLKENCMEYMKSILSVDTFCDIIALSLRHSELELQKAATRFFCKNVKKIIKTGQWQVYIQNNPIPANELYIKAFKA